jgi:hypothetical protein
MWCRHSAFYLLHYKWLISVQLQSIRGDVTVNANKPSPVSPQLTARSGQCAQLVQCTHCIRTHVNVHSDFGHPCNGTRFTWSLHDFILKAKEISRAFVYDDSFVSANGLVDCFTYLLTELSPSWEAANCAAIQEFPCNFKEPEGSSSCPRLLVNLLDCSNNYNKKIFFSGRPRPSNTVQVLSNSRNRHTRKTERHRYNIHASSRFRTSESSVQET